MKNRGNVYAQLKIKSSVNTTFMLPIYCVTLVCVLKKDDLALSTHPR